MLLVEEVEEHDHHQRDNQPQRQILVKRIQLMSPPEAVGLKGCTRLSTPIDKKDRRIPGVKDLVLPPTLQAQGPRQATRPQLACLLARHRRYIRRHISRFAPKHVPWWRTKIQRHLGELFFAPTLTPISGLRMRK
jgi:hypothetical protein